MSKFWMLGSAVAAASVAIMVWNAQPVRSSESLLGKAQSEFAMKARDALMQRYMAQSSTAAATSVASKAGSLLPYATASLEPVAAPITVARKALPEVTAPEPQAAIVVPVDAPVAAQEIITPSVALPAQVADTAPPAKMQMASLPDESHRTISQQPAAAPVYETAKADTSAVTPTAKAPRQKMKAAHNGRLAPKQPMAGFDGRRTERPAFRTLTRGELQVLRARSPELAAAIARYM